MDSLAAAEILHHLPVALAVVEERSGRFIRINRGFVELFGRPPDSALADWWQALAPALDPGDLAWAGLAQKLAGLHEPERESCETHMYGGDGLARLIRVDIQRRGGQILLCFVDLSDNDYREDFLRQALIEMETRSATDSLTGLLSRQRFEETAASEMHRFRRFGHPISLVMADIDHFKKVNDALGHPEGDLVLVEFARRLQAECRDLDTIGRYGGEEFLILLPNTPLAGGVVLAEKLREAIAITPFGAAGMLGASFGVAECQANEAWPAWLERCDKALYQAKNGGRNQVIAAPESAFGELPPGKGRIDRLIWEEGHSVGHALIDGQHRDLFERGNALLAMIRDTAAPATIHACIRDLGQAVSHHFRDEEAVLTHVGYPRVSHHAKGHRILSAKLDALSSQSALGTLPIQRLIEFLAYDLIDHHAIGADRDYIPWLRHRTQIQ